MGAPIDQLQQDEARARAVLESAMQAVFAAATAEIAFRRAALVTYLEKTAREISSLAAREAIARHLRNLPPPIVLRSRTFRASSAYALYVTQRETRRDFAAAATVIEHATSGAEPDSQAVKDREAAILSDLGSTRKGNEPSLISPRFEDAASAAHAARQAWERVNEALQSAATQAETKRRLKAKWGTGTSGLTT